LKKGGKITPPLGKGEVGRDFEEADFPTKKGEERCSRVVRLRFYPMTISNRFISALYPFSGGQGLK
jgi:hypothetical protein